MIDGKDNEIGRLRLGKEICTTRKRKNILNDQQSGTHREKLGNIVELATEFSDNESITSEGNDVYTQENSCIVCLVPRLRIWIFIQCRKCQFYSTCIQRIEELRQPYPICRATIESRFQICI